MKTIITLALAAGASLGMAADPKPIIAKPNEVIMNVGGIVCQFCAYGVSRNLNPFGFLDRAKLRNGVFVDIKSNRVVVALKPGEAPDFRKLQKAIAKGGYELLSAHMQMNGKLTREGETWMLLNDRDRAHYEIIGGVPEGFQSGRRVTVQAELCGVCIESIPAGKPLPITIVKVEVSSQ